MADNKEDTKRPEDSNFKQQRLKAWQPLLTPPWVIGTFFVVGIIFIPIGAVIFTASQSVVEVSARYDNTCTGTCTVTLTPDKDMKKPVYLYYQLTNFYQNHRRYVKSRSDTQLSGDKISDTSACDPLTTNFEGKNLFPCGLIAASYFNDTIASADGLGWSSSDIAWKSDKDKKFKDPGRVGAYGVVGYPDYSRQVSAGVSLPNIDDEHFIVWMRTAGLPTFKKLYFRLESDIPANTPVKFTVTSNFPVNTFNGEKHLVMSTTSWIGGKNDFLGIAYLAVGGICLMLGTIFWIKHCVSPRKLGDMTYINSNKPN